MIFSATRTHYTSTPAKNGGVANRSGRWEMGMGKLECRSQARLSSHQFRSLPSSQEASPCELSNLSLLYTQTLASQTLDMAVPKFIGMHSIMYPWFHGAGAWRRSSRHPPDRDEILVGQSHTQPTTLGAALEILQPITPAVSLRGWTQARQTAPQGQSAPAKLRIMVNYVARCRAAMQPWSTQKCTVPLTSIAVC